MYAASNLPRDFGTRALAAQLSERTLGGPRANEKCHRLRQRQLALYQSGLWAYTPDVSQAALLVGVRVYRDVSKEEWCILWDRAKQIEQMLPRMRRDALAELKRRYPQVDYKTWAGLSRALADGKFAPEIRAYLEPVDSRIRSLEGEAVAARRRSEQLLAAIHAADQRPWLDPKVDPIPKSLYPKLDHCAAYPLREDCNHGESETARWQRCEYMQFDGAPGRWRCAAASQNPAHGEAVHKPEGFQHELSDFKACVFDGYCGEPVAWGFEILQHLGEERFNSLGKHGVLECIYPAWFLITRRLSREDAILRYGKVTEEEFGPRGGWKSVTFGSKKFISKSLKS